MPHPATPGPGEGESSAISPILPSAQAYPEEGFSSSTARSSASSSSSSILPSSRERPLSVRELKNRTDEFGRPDAGAEVDLQVAELRRSQGQASSSSSSAGPSKEKLAPPKGWLHFAAGGVAGMCGGIITAPLDVAKTRLQSSVYQQQQKQRHPTAAAGKGAWATSKRLAMHFVETGQLLKEIATKEGPRALFKGLGPTLVGAVPARSINFYTYGNGKLFLAETFNGGRETPVVHLSAAAMAGITTATATNPIWVVKTRLQLESSQLEREAKQGRAAAVRKGPSVAPQPAAAASATTTTTTTSRTFTTSTASSAKSIPLSEGSSFFRPARTPPRPSTNSFTMVSRIVRQEGIAGLYRGMTASYLGVLEGTIQWTLYERLKRTAIFTSTSSAQGKDPTLGERITSTVGAAGTAKLTASLITYPHEVVRTRLRQQPEGGVQKYKTLIQTIKLVWKEEGAAALYGGLSAHLMRVVPNAAVMFSIYEAALRLGAHAQANEQERVREAERSKGLRAMETDTE